MNGLIALIDDSYDRYTSMNNERISQIAAEVSIKQKHSSSQLSCQYSLTWYQPIPCWAMGLFHEISKQGRLRTSLQSFLLYVGNDVFSLRKCTDNVQILIAYKNCANHSWAGENFCFQILYLDYFTKFPFYFVKK